MEDASIVDLSFDNNHSLFAIFDGHGGEEVAKFCSHNFSKILKENKAYQEQNYR